MKLKEQSKTGGELRLERRKLLDKMHLKLSDEENKRLLDLDDLIDQLPANQNAEDRKMMEQIRKTSSLLFTEANSEIGIAIGLVDTIINSATILDNLMTNSLKAAVEVHNKKKGVKLKEPLTYHLGIDKKLQNAILDMYENSSVKHLYILGFKYTGETITI